MGVWSRARQLFATGGRQRSSRLEQRFAGVYENRLWLSEESVSGAGSGRGSEQVAHALHLLTRFCDGLELASLADLPCGDFNWMPIFLGENPDIDYVGYDVVPALVEANLKAHPLCRFEVLDITQQVPAPADLLFSKDLLNHLSESDVWAALENMVASGSEYLMLTTNRGFANTDLDPTQPHASRYLDLEAAPYALTDAIYGDHYILLFRSRDVGTRLRQRRSSVVGAR
jgi:hypothetical protein